MDNDTLIATSVKRLGDATERLTQKEHEAVCYMNMCKPCAMRHGLLQAGDASPQEHGKLLPLYQPQGAGDILEKEMKDNDEKPMGRRLMAETVPDELCYQWAEEYFRDLDVKEDKTEEDEKFVPRPYRGISSTPKKKVEKKKPAACEKREAKGTGAVVYG